MQKVIIDTNIYYSLVEISENLKVNKDSFLNFDKYITSATLIECIIKYRNDLTTLDFLHNLTFCTKSSIRVDQGTYQIKA